MTLFQKIDAITDELLFRIPQATSMVVATFRQAEVRGEIHSAALILVTTKSSDFRPNFMCSTMLKAKGVRPLRNCPRRVLQRRIPCTAPLYARAN